MTAEGVREALVCRFGPVVPVVLAWRYLCATGELLTEPRSDPCE